MRQRCESLREERFMCNPLMSNRPYGSLYGFISPFVKEVVKDLNLTRSQFPSRNRQTVPLVVKKAADGIIEEGTKIGKQREAEEIAKILMERKEAGMKEVWKCCAYLYSLESFLYKKLNEVMRLIGDENQEQIWRSMIPTLGPFCLLLWDNPLSSRMAKPGAILYRGAQLSNDLISLCKDDCTKDPKPLRSFQAFTPCTRNPIVAEMFGNVMFIMKVRVAFTVDLSPVSNYPHEEEELLYPGVCFAIDGMEFDKNKNKHIIYLTLQQRHSKVDQHQLSKDLQQSAVQNKHTGLDNDLGTDERAAYYYDTGRSDVDDGTDPADRDYDIFDHGYRHGFEYDWKDE